MCYMFCFFALCPANFVEPK
ncbi:hypothetical protein CUMW_115840 [Citrus unshiu]|uniref:Uncharacterized protein n=1 Tax=Citrus unshiu TaxID=55188 RepID=A0A2H5P9I8_CITUN|nr:hypothetical protein CUMW_115840 [Citrus unshiu]